MQVKKSSSYYVSRIIILISIMILAYDLFCFAVKNILYDGFGIVNNFVISIARLDEYTLKNDGIANSDTDSEQNTESDIDIEWEKLYPFKNDENVAKTQVLADELQKISMVSKYLEVAEHIASKTNERFEFFLPLRKTAIHLNQKVFGAWCTDNSTDSIIYLKNGYMTYTENKESAEVIDTIADCISEFNEYLSEKDIPFLYVNAGSKVCPYDKQLPLGAIEFTNENGDDLLLALEKRNVDYLDMRDKMIEDGLDWYDSYYKTDHHWTTETGLWAAGVLAEELNNNYGFEFDKKFFDQSSYDKIENDHFWIGGQGRQVGYKESFLESFSLFVPKYETDYSIEIPTRNLNRRGEYSQTLINPDVINEIKQYSKNDYIDKKDAYGGCTNITNLPLNHIKNHINKNNKGKKILMLQDSFSYYSTGFLASDISEIDTMHPKLFTGSIRKYVDESKPDMVIMMLCEKQIGYGSDIDWDAHNNVWDLQ